VNLGAQMCRLDDRSVQKLCHPRPLVGELQPAGSLRVSLRQPRLLTARLDLRMIDFNGDVTPFYTSAPLPSGPCHNQSIERPKNGAQFVQVRAKSDRDSL